jgi:hypothetical protein
MRGLIAFLFVPALLPFGALSASAQVIPAAPQDTLLPPADTIPHEGPLPRSAFIRALLVPGWGHFGMGEYRRGAVYVSLQGASWFMLVKTALKLNDARDIEGGVAALARDSLQRAMAADTAVANRLANPAAFDEAMLTYPGLVGARSLVSSRERHRQDWIVYTVVTTFAAAVDAYVTAHLAEFPADIMTERSRDGGTSVGLRVPIGGRR